MADAPAWFAKVVEAARGRARGRVAALRAEHPREDEVALGRRLIGSAAIRAGWYGAASGTLALITFPIGLPAGIAVSLLLEAELIFSLLELYGVPTGGEAGRLKLYALWAGAGLAGAARSVGLRSGARALGRVLWESIPGRLVRRLDPALVRAILGRLGLGWLPRTLKLWPVLGAPVAFVLDRAALRTLGEGALAALDDDARARRRARKPRRRRPARLEVAGA